MKNNTFWILITGAFVFYLYRKQRRASMVAPAHTLPALPAPDLPVAEGEPDLPPAFALPEIVKMQIKETPKKGRMVKIWTRAPSKKP